MRTATRSAATGALTIAASWAGLAPSAGAAPANPFAGNYAGEVRYGGGCQEVCFKPYWELDVTISSSGRITGVANYYENVYWGVYQSPAGDGSVSGSISEGGTLKLTAKEGKRSAKFNGAITTGANGEIYCTGTAGGSTAYLGLTPQ